MELFGEERKLGKLYEDGEYIFKQGDQALNFYVVQEGKVELFLQTAAGEISFSVARDGEIIGISSLFANKARYLTARALEQARVLKVDQRTFLAQFHDDPSVAFRILEKLAQRVYELDHQIIQRLHDHGVDQRVLLRSHDRNRFDIFPGHDHFSSVTDILGNELERSRLLEQRLALVRIEIDGWQDLEPSVSAMVRDSQLVNLAELLRRKLRTTDMIGRHSEAGFSVILYEADGYSAVRLMQRICDAFARTPLKGEGTVPGHFTSSFSCGIAVFPEYDTELDLLKAAADALQTAQIKGNCVVLNQETRSSGQQKGNKLNPNAKPRGRRLAVDLAMTFFKRMNVGG